MNMEVIKNAAESPILVVSDVIYDLQRLSNLCFLLGQFQNNPPADTIPLSDVGDAMSVISDCLDRQVKALDAIQWPKEKAVGA